MRAIDEGYVREPILCSPAYVFIYSLVTQYHSPEYKLKCTLHTQVTLILQEETEEQQ